MMDVFLGVMTLAALPFALGAIVLIFMGVLILIGLIVGKR